ncbi:MAG: McrC family protein [Clostridia bacterium]|nr:McrC family protein [Clostridia bacterium]
MKTITVREYSAFREGTQNGERVNGYVTLKKSTFDMLERFVLETNREGEDGALEIMSLSARRGVGKIITVKNFVGVVTLNDGTTIEILPKIYSAQDEEDNQEARRLLVCMLNTVYNVSAKNLQTANLDVARMNILEVFIRMFVEEVQHLTKTGLKSSYEILEENLTCFKGKIQFSKHLRHNLAHKERIYVAYDEFTVNRPENRLLKSTLAYLCAHTHSVQNKKNIKNLLTIFGDVALSANFDADFARIVPDRNTKAYTTALNWARVFLKRKSFTSFSGSTVSIALLFPMEKLFESYIPALMRRALAGRADAVISTQDKRHHLFDGEKKCFLLKPDIVLNTGGKVFIMDTKWKRLNGDASVHYGISQADMYQMYAYYQKYGKTESVTLLYPKVEGISEKPDYEDSVTQAKVKVRFIDMSTAERSADSVRRLMQEYGILPQ